jgi:dTDP-4-amino-4,6-dideoxygalactose transaminase
MQAALGLAQLERISSILDRKRRIGSLYDSLLGGVSGLKLQNKRDWAHVNYSMYGLVLTDEVEMDACAFGWRLAAEDVDSVLSSWACMSNRSSAIAACSLGCACRWPSAFTGAASISPRDRH